MISPCKNCSHKSDLIQFAVWFGKINNIEMNLHHIMPTDVRQYKQHLIDSNFRPRTINRRLLSLKYFLEWGWDSKKIKYRFPLPQTVKQAQTTPKWLTRIEQN